MSGKNLVALCLIALAASAAGQSPAFLDQNWSDQIRFQFWFMDQGSRIMPLDWFMRLEKANKTDRFADGLERYGFVPDNFSAPHANPSPDSTRKLPIGFTKNTSSGQDFVGLTCAACHTNKISSGDKSWFIEGGPSMLNFDMFLAEMVDALDDIVPGSQKAQRFWNGLPTQAQTAQFQKVKSALEQRKRINTPPTPAGFARVDAFGHIFNEVLTVGLNDETATVLPNAPASYPFLWDISQHKIVQWNGTAPNLGVGKDAIGSLIRNIGEVLGVFGEFTVTGATLPGLPPNFTSSVNTGNLKLIEDWVSTLRSPAWPAGEPAFGTINDADRAQGEQLYNQHCVQCHAVVKRSAPVPTPVPITMVPVADGELGTDAQEIANFLNRRADAGILTGSFYLLDPAHLVFTDQTPVRNLTGYIALGVFNNKEHPTPLALLEASGQALTAYSAFLPDIPPKFNRYKARPLDGIWATAPYLHNGSVASLRELLTPPAKRLTMFCIGDGQFDAYNVGYKTYTQKMPDGSVTTACPDRSSIFDTTKTGNSKQGHTYGTELLDNQKNQLIEYLKSL
jgi:mono/diheme cytochrome c family protein